MTRRTQFDLTINGVPAYSVSVNGGKAVSTRSGTVLRLGVAAGDKVVVTPAPAPAPAPTGILRAAGDAGTDWTGRDITKYSLLIVGGDGIPAAKQWLQPGKKALIYTDACFCHASYQEGIAYSTVTGNGWALPGSTSELAYFDLTKPACVTAVAEAAVAYAKGTGLTGLFLDDVGPKTVNVNTPAGFRDGIISLVSQTHALCRAAGLYFMVNANGYGDPTLGNPDNGDADIAWSKLLSCDAQQLECYQQVRDGSMRLRVRGENWDQFYDEWQRVPAAIEAQGKDFMPTTYAIHGTTQAQQDNAHLYGLGSLLTLGLTRTTYDSMVQDAATGAMYDGYGSWVTATSVTVNAANGTASTP